MTDMTVSASLIADPANDRADSLRPATSMGAVRRAIWLARIWLVWLVVLLIVYPILIATTDDGRATWQAHTDALTGPAQAVATLTAATGPAGLTAQAASGAGVSAEMAAATTGAAAVLAAADFAAAAAIEEALNGLTGPDGGAALAEAVTAARAELAARRTAQHTAVEAVFVRVVEYPLALAIASGAFMVVALPGVVIVTLLWLSRPILRLRTLLAALANGDTDVDIAKAKTTGKLEDIRRATEVFRRDLIERQALKAERARLEAEAAHVRRTAMTDMADGFQAAFQSGAGKVAGYAETLRDAAHSVDGANRQSHAKGREVGGAAERASQQVTTVAAAIDELSASVDEIGRQSEAWRGLTDDAHAAGDGVRETVHRLANAVDKVKDAVDRINDIAAKTGMLALNASVEAARTGDSGGDFALVADEVKDLSQQTAEATERIQGLIAAIESGTGKAHVMIQEVAMDILRMGQLASEIDGQLGSQRTATRDMAAAIARSIDDMSQTQTLIAEVISANNQSGALVEPVVGESDQLAQLADRLRSESDDVATGIRANA